MILYFIQFTIKSYVTKEKIHSSDFDFDSDKLTICSLQTK